jgi:lysophospholipase
MMRVVRRPILLSTLLLTAVNALHAIPEKDYTLNDAKEVAPFLTSGQRFSFRSADGKIDLQGIRFVHPKAKGTIVVVNGNTESWLKYGELFHDLYQNGFSVTSYDHRGQGLSPHLVPANSQIGQIDDFALYAADLNAFVQQEIAPEKKEKAFLLAHSMGGGVALDYLEHYPSPFRAVALSAPMLRINTSPYPESVAWAASAFFHAIGRGDHYVMGKHDRNPSKPFEGNTLTSSRDRWNAIQSVWNSHPDAVLGGPSNDWVARAIPRTSVIREQLPQIKDRVLILQAGQDQFVMNPDQDIAQKKIPGAILIRFPDAKHEILMESDPIRQKALAEILRFFESAP